MYSIKDKEDGGIQIFIIISFLVYLIVFMYTMSMTRYALSNYIMDFKNNADMANFATYEYINQNELAQSNQAVFNDTDLNNVYLTFKSYLIKNHKLDSNLRPLDTKGFITEPLKIKRIIVYSIKNGLISEYEYTDLTHSFNTVLSGYNGTVYTPTGRKVCYTSVYTDVGFTLDLFNIHYKYSDSIRSYTAIRT